MFLVAVASITSTLEAAEAPVKELYASSAQLTSALEMEREMTKVLMDNRNEITNKLPSASDFVHQLQQMWEAESISSLVGNPIHAFQVIRRLHVQWKELLTKFARGGLIRK